MNTPLCLVLLLLSFSTFVSSIISFYLGKKAGRMEAKEARQKCINMLYDPQDKKDK